MNSRTDPTRHTHHSNLGSTAVDGLIAGAAAGVAMIAYLLITAGESPADLLNRFTGAGMQPSPITGTVAHLAVSAIYGMVFGVLWNALHGSQRLVIRVIAGVVYGLILFVAAEWVILPAVESPLLDIPILHWGIADVIYGIVLGLILRSAKWSM